MDGERASLLVPGTTLVASLVAGTTYAVYRAHQLAERWKPRGVWLLPVLFVVATSISYVADGGTLTQPPVHGAAGAAPRPHPTVTQQPPPTAPPAAATGVPVYALPKQGLDITYDFGPPGSPHPVPGSASATSATFPIASRATTSPSSAHPVPPSRATPPPPPPSPSPPPPTRRIIPPLPSLPRPPVPRLPVPPLR
jgi:hypothetical protein